jgi:hypothetical protein
MEEKEDGQRPSMKQSDGGGGSSSINRNDQQDALARPLLEIPMVRYLEAHFRILRKLLIYVPQAEKEVTNRNAS